MGKATDLVRAEYEQKLAEAEKEDSLHDALNLRNIIQPRFAHVSELYGSVASLHFGNEYSQESVSVQNALSIIQVLSPIAVTLVRDCSCSFRPTEIVNSISKKDKEKWKSEDSVCSVWFDIKWLQLSNSVSHTPCLIANWFANIENIGIVRVHVYLGHPVKIDDVQAHREEYKGGFRYENTRFSPAEKMRRIYTATGECVANIPNHILWGRGSDQVPNDITIYYDRINTVDPKVVGEAILAVVENRSLP
jgi:hypothetical protein